MATTATTSQLTTFKVKISSVFTLVAQIVGFTGPSIVQDLEDITNLDSTGGFKEWFPTLRDGGSVTFDMIWNAADTAHAHLQASNAAGTLDDYEITFPFVTPEVYTFSGYTTKFEFKAQKGASLKVGVEIKVTGTVTATP